MKRIFLALIACLLVVGIVACSNDSKEIKVAVSPASPPLVFDQNGKIVGSELIGQNFTDAKYFHPRPSMAGDVGYDATSSGGSNLGPTSKKLIDLIKKRVEAFRAENNLPLSVKVPVDAVTASASGLDPHISVRNALLQAPRIAKARGMEEKAVVEKIEANTQGRDLYILGEPRVNVLTVNLSLDARRF